MKEDALGVEEGRDHRYDRIVDEMAACFLPSPGHPKCVFVLIKRKGFPFRWLFPFFLMLPPSRVQSLIVSPLFFLSLFQWKG